MIVTTLALGIGANSTMFGVLSHLLLDPPEHIAEPDRVFTIHLRAHGDATMQSTHPYVYRTMFRDAVTAFDDVAVATPTGVLRRQYFPVGRGEHAARLAGALVSNNYFSVLGVRPALGRFFTEQEASDDGAPPSIVLGYGYWQTTYAGRADVVGQTVDVGDSRYTVIGVAPQGFTGTELRDVDAWLPIGASRSLRFDKQPDWMTSENAQWLLLVARLKPGVTRERAEHEATAVYRSWSRARAADQSLEAMARIDSEAVVLGSVVPGKSPWEWNGSGSKSDARVSVLMSGVAFVVLLIACANVANLLLVRALARRHEVAVRLALGATSNRLLREFASEALMLSLAGTLGALIVTAAGSQVVRRWLIGDGAWSASALTGRAILVTFAAGVVTVVATSLIPALQLSRLSLSHGLKGGPRDGTVQRSHLRIGILAAQAALAIVLLAGATMFLRSLNNAARLDLGIDADHVLVGQLSQGGTSLSNADARQLFARFEERARAIPGVQATAYSIGLPFSLSWGTRVRVPGRVLPKLPQQPVQYAVSPGYFAALGIRTLLGRTFTTSDGAGAPRVVVVNETMARLYWPDQSPIGACITGRADSLPCAIVVGVVADTRRQRLLEAPVPQFYRPIDQVSLAESASTVSFFGYSFVARTRGPALASVGAVRRALQTAAPAVPYVVVQPMRDLFARETRGWTLGARVFSAFGTLALLLCGMGLFSVVLFTLSQRRHEMGVRSALGARRIDLLRLMLSRGMMPAVIGIAIGVVLALLSARSLDGLLFQESPRDAVALGTAAGLMLTTAFVACLLPAWKASRIAPTTALRAD